jgi:hypothetical protein
MAYFMARLVRNLGEKVVFLGSWSQWEIYRVGSGAFGVSESLFLLNFGLVFSPNYCLNRKIQANQLVYLS